MNNRATFPLSIRVMSVFCVSAVLVPFMGSAFNLTLPQIALRFSFTSTSLAWFNTAFVIAAALFQLPFAKLGDKYGRRKIYSLGLAGLAVTLFISPLSPNTAILICLRFISGIFAAMFFATGMAILVAVVHPSNRAKALAINVAAVYSALAAGPVLGGFLAEHFGWQSIFYFTGAVSIAAFLTANLWIERQEPIDRGERFDFAGALLFGIALIAIIYGFTAIPKPRGFISLIIGVPAMAAFICYELKISAPIINIRLFTENHLFAFSNLAALINYSASASTTFMISLHLQFVLGFRETTAGLALISQAILQVAASLAAGKLSERFTPAKLATAGMLFSAAGLFGLIFTTASTPASYIIANLMLTGLGFGLFSSPNTNAIMSSVDKRYYGQASAVTATMRQVGMSFSMGMAGLFLSIFIGDMEVSAAVAPFFLSALRWVFIVSFIMCLAGAYCSGKR